MKTKSIHFFLLIIFLAVAQNVFAKGCMTGLRCYVGSSYSYQVNGVIDTTISGDAMILDPFVFWASGPCGDIQFGGCGFGCRPSTIRSYFNGQPLTYRSYLPAGVEGTLIDYIYYIACCDTTESLFAIATLNVHLISTGISQINLTPHFSLYPNPAKNYFSINQGSEIKNGVVEIFNMVGEKVYSEPLKPKPINLNLSPGVYFVRVSDDEKMLTQKLIVQ